MSLWISRKDKAGARHLWLIDTHPILPLLVVGLGIMVVVSHPSLIAWVSLAILSAGVVCIAVAKVSLFRRGIWISWGAAQMTKWNARIYKAGYAVIGCGVVLLSMAWLATR